MGRSAYTPEQNAWLEMWYPVTTNRELADAFAAEFGEQVTPSAMNAWGSNHHVRKVDGVKGMANRRYTDEQLDFLREAIPGRPLSKVGELYEERYGVRLTHGALANLRTKLGVLCGVNDGCFKKGQEPPNKGRTWDEMGIDAATQERMRSTTFSKGNLPWNTRPLLDVRVSRHGDREIHVGLHRRKRANDQWIPLAHFNWMQANGRDWPDGHKALHLDHDPLNDAADNVMPVPNDLWPLVMGAVPGQLEWHDRETAEAAVAFARVTRARTDAERRLRIALGRPRKGDLDADAEISPARVDVD